MLTWPVLLSIAPAERGYSRTAPQPLLQSQETQLTPNLALFHVQGIEPGQMHIYMGCSYGTLSFIFGVHILVPTIRCPLCVRQLPPAPWL